MSGFWRGLLRILGVILSELALMAFGAVLVALGFAVLVYGLSIDNNIYSGLGSVALFVGFVLCMKHFV